MQQIAIDAANARALAMIPESCGPTTVGCSDVSGVLEAVIDSSKRLRSEREAMAETVRALDRHHFPPCRQGAARARQLLCCRALQ
jgi:methyl-accepting chemotaxis protein